MVRISVGLEAEQAERVRRHAAQEGMDVSACLVRAGGRQMAETEAMEARFAGVDALIAEAEAEAAALPPLSADSVGDLTEQEEREAEEAPALIYGTGRPGPRGGVSA